MAVPELIHPETKRLAEDQDKNEIRFDRQSETKPARAYF